MRLKYILTIFFALVMAITISGQADSGTPVDTVNQAILQFEAKLVDLREVKINSKTSGKFQFTNKGGQHLVIKEVKPHCGCTVANYTNHPIAPGKSGEINFEYSAPAHPAEIRKTMVVVANTYEKSYLVKIKAKVIE